MIKQINKRELVSNNILSSQHLTIHNTVNIYDEQFPMFYYQF